MTYNNACNTDQRTLIYDFWFYGCEMPKRIWEMGKWEMPKRIECQCKNVSMQQLNHQKVQPI